MVLWSNVLRAIG